MMSSDGEPRALAGDFDYDGIGHGYAQERRADPRIESYIHTALGNARTILNVGAGAGSYEPRDRYVLAVEPSRAMREQRPPDSVPAIDAVAENLPLDSGSVDASMAIITVHQWKDAGKGLAELLRVTRESIVVLTFDGDVLERYWLYEYAPELIAAERGRYMPMTTLTDWMGDHGSRRVEITKVPIPIDCSDGIIEAYYARPEGYLEDRVRRAQSGWGFVGPDAERRFVRHLRRDIQSSAWDNQYGNLRTQSTYDGSLRMVVSRPK